MQQLPMKKCNEEKNPEFGSISRNQTAALKYQRRPSTSPGVNEDRKSQKARIDFKKEEKKRHSTTTTLSPHKEKSSKKKKGKRKRENKNCPFSLCFKIFCRTLNLGCWQRADGKKSSLNLNLVELYLYSCWTLNFLNL